MENVVNECEQKLFCTSKLCNKVGKARKKTEVVSHTCKLMRELTSSILELTKVKKSRIAI
jgi:hypothetical protein